MMLFFVQDIRLSIMSIGFLEFILLGPCIDIEPSSPNIYLTTSQHLTASARLTSYDRIQRLHKLTYILNVLTRQYHGNVKSS